MMPPTNTKISISFSAAFADPTCAKDSERSAGRGPEAFGSKISQNGPQLVQESALMLLAVIDRKKWFTLFFAQFESKRGYRWRRLLSIELLLTTVAGDMMFWVNVSWHASLGLVWPSRSRCALAHPQHLLCCRPWLGE